MDNRRRKGGKSQEEGEKGAIEEVMMMGIVQIFKIGYVHSNIHATRRKITLWHPDLIWNNLCDFRTHIKMNRLPLKMTKFRFCQKGINNVILE